MTDHDLIIRLDEKVGQLETKVDSATTELKAIRGELTKYKGFLGGIMLTASLVATAVSIAWKFILTKGG